jgi:hypothetical protein
VSPLSPAAILKALAPLAKRVATEREFLKLAKDAWRDVNFWKIRRRGKPSVEDECFRAITDGYHALGMASSPGDNYSFDSMPELIIARDEDTGDHQRLPLSWIMQMLLDQVPGIEPSTARKFARMYEEDQEYPPLTHAARWKLVKRMTRQFPAFADHVKQARHRPR